MKKNVFSLAAVAMTAMLAACGGKGERRFCKHSL